MAYIGLVGADEETLSAEFDAIIAGGRSTGQAPLAPSSQLRPPQM